MKNQTALTIDSDLTKERFDGGGRSVAKYARVREFIPTTLGRVLNGSYPHVEDPESEYQKILRCLKADGILVENTPTDAQAA